MNDPGKAVFLSYASQDAEAARRIAGALREAGVEVWFDQNELRGGDSWDRKIREQIKTCALFVPIISANTQTRGEGYFRLEWKLADRRTDLLGKSKAFLVPVCVDDTTDADADVPDSFLAVQWMRLRDGQMDAAAVNRIATLLHGEVAQPASAASSAHAPPHAPVPVSASVRRKRRPNLLLGAITAIVIGTGVAIWLTTRSKENANVSPSIVPSTPVSNDSKGAEPPGQNDAALKTVPVDAAVPTASSEQLTKEGSSSPSLSLSTPVPAALDKSIAVLPFANMSEERENAFFADGVQEDILTNLSNIHELRVVSRTSVMGYRGTTKSLPQIALELGVTYILEGSVRRTGNKVRVTGQLIRAATDEHIWAKSFDRDLTDIFAIQSEVAQAIATALQAVISPQEKSLIEQTPTDNIAAYDAYTKARQILTAGAQEGFNDLVPLLKTAVLLDPKFAQAWAELGSVYSRRYFDYWEHTPEVLASAKDAIDRAVGLAPDDPVVIQKLGDYYYYGLRDYRRAARQYRLLADQYPNYAPAQASLAFIDRRLGRWKEALEGLRRAVDLEPRNLRFSSALVETLTDLRRYDEAEAVQRQVIALGENSPYQRVLLAMIRFEAGGSTMDFDALANEFATNPKQAHLALVARYETSRMKADIDSYIEVVGKIREMQGLGRFPWEEECRYAMGLKIQGDMDQARALLEKRVVEERAKVEKQQLPRSWMALSVAYAVLDDKEEALRCAQAAIDLVPESADATEGTRYTGNRAMILAWVGKKDEALAEVERLLGVPGGLKVEELRKDPFWKPLQGDPRFQALLDDPKNNAPLL